MPASSRRKGIADEREVADRWELAGAAVRGLEGQGDHLVICTNGLTIHSEVKRAERLKIPEWWKQTAREAPQGTLPVLHHRQNRGEWLVTMRLDDLAALVTADVAGIVLHRT
jgi:hypothetical protein